MKAVEIALFVICIQAGLGITIESGMFGDNMYYESEFTDVTLQNNMSALDTTEQDQVSLDIFSTVTDILTWGFIKQFFQPLYNNDTAVKTFVDHLRLFLTGISSIIIGAAVIEFFRNQTKVL